MSGARRVLRHRAAGRDGEAGGARCGERNDEGRETAPVSVSHGPPFHGSIIGESDLLANAPGGWYPAAPPPHTSADHLLIQLPINRGTLLRIDELRAAYPLSDRVHPRDLGPGRGHRVDFLGRDAKRDRGTSQWRVLPLERVRFCLDETEVRSLDDGLADVRAVRIES